MGGSRQVKSDETVFEEASIKRLKAIVEYQAAVIRRQYDELQHTQTLFHRACTAAKVGVWECTLDNEMLYWSDSLYEIFELPKGSTVTRDLILQLYPEEARARLESARLQAIQDRTGFRLETEIRTFKGNNRWIRLTATVECEAGVPVRLIGIKQDITEERLLLDQTRSLAERDALTTLSNRSIFQAALKRIDSTQPDRNRVSALLMIDIDNFKDINDTHGHLVGDRCLIEVGQRLTTVVTEATTIARIGGDEFAILLDQQCDTTEIITIGRRIIACFDAPVSGAGRPVQISVSVGIARFVEQTSDDLFFQADLALYAAKEGGRQTFKLYEQLPESKNVRTGSVG